MNNIINTTNNKIETITSMEVAQMLQKEHAQLLKDIRRYIKQINIANETSTPQVKIDLGEFFIETTYQDANNQTRPCFSITHKGCEFLANKLTGQKGTEFTARYVNRFHELEEGNITNSFISALNSISESMNIMRNEINDRLTKLEETQQNKKKIPEKKYSRWKTNIFNKLNTLLSYVNENSDETLKLSEIIHLVISETEDTYSIEMNDYMDAYKSEYELQENPYVIDVINHYKDIKDMFTLTLDSIMEKLHISQEHNINKNIFDELAEKMEKENIPLE